MGECCTCQLRIEGGCFENLKRTLVMQVQNCSNWLISLILIILNLCITYKQPLARNNNRYKIMIMYLKHHSGVHVLFISPSCVTTGAVDNAVAVVHSTIIISFPTVGVVSRRSVSNTSSANIISLPPPRHSHPLKCSRHYCQEPTSNYCYMSSFFYSFVC